MIDKGLTQSISFAAGSYDLYDYVSDLAKERFGNNFSLAIQDCIKAHQQATRIYGDYRQMESIPGWANALLARETDNGTD